MLTSYVLSLSSHAFQFPEETVYTATTTVTTFGSIAITVPRNSTTSTDSEAVAGTGVSVSN